MPSAVSLLTLSSALFVLASSACSAGGASRSRGHVEPPRAATAQAAIASSSASKAKELARAEVVVDEKGKVYRLDPTVYNIEVSADDPHKGKADALVTVVMFGNFQDRFSARASSTMRALLQKYGDDLRLVWKHLPMPLHPRSRAAATLAEEARIQGGEARFWQAHDLLFTNQEALGDQDLERYAQQLELSPAALREALKSDRHAKKIDGDAALAKRLNAIPTTPQFVINGRYVLGAQVQGYFEKLIGVELEKAKQRVASGTPRAHIYEESVRDGATEPVEPPEGAVGGPPPRVELPLPTSAPRRGARNAQVVIQEFCDFECPFCARVQPTLSSLLREYGDRVQLVFRHYPLGSHPHAHHAAAAAEELFAQGGDAAFWAFHDRLFAHQGELDDAQLESHARAVTTLDVQAFREALQTEAHAERVASDARALEATGARVSTPTFWINGRILQGTLPLEAFRSAIERALEQR